MKNLLTILFVLAIAPAFSQYNMNLTNGKSKKIQSYEALKSDAEVGQLIYYKNKKGKTRKIDPDEVFSFVSENGKEDIIYKPREGYSEYTVAEMRDYVDGQKGALDGFKSPGSFVGGVAIGTAAPFALGYYSPLLPAAFSTTMGVSPFENVKLKGVDQSKVSDAYMKGYREGARGIRVKNSLIGGGIGLVVGVSAVLVFGLDSWL